MKLIVGSGSLGLVGLGLTANTLAPLSASISQYGNTIITIGIGVALVEFIVSRKSKFEKLFINCNLYVSTGTEKLLPILIRKQKHELSTDYIFTLPPGLSLKDFINKQDAIEQNIRKPITLDFNNGVIIMNVSEPLRKIYEFKNILYPEPLKVCIGYSYNGQYALDIEEAVHILVGGSTGWGKSVFMRLLTVLLLQKPIQLYLVDFMRVELGIFKKYATGYCKNAQEFDYLLDDLANIADERLKKFEKKSVSGIKSWNKKYKPMEYIVVLIDEFASIATNKNLQAKFNLATAQYRKVGIHFITTTQRCSTDIISGTIKNNMATRVCFRVASDTDSRVVLDESGAENLKYQGRCLIKLDKLSECQIMYLSEEQALEVVRNGYKE